MLFQERSSTTSARSKIGLIAGPLLILAAPSVWLLSAVPPLWRDRDAYGQLTAAPGVSTILLHGPLYCALARLPLWAGYLITATGRSTTFGDFVLRPQLTNAGIYTLIAMQHMGLWLGLLYLIASLTDSLWRRCLLALFCASHGLFYAFAHCVGSESLSLIGILFLVGIGLRMVMNYPEMKTWEWLAAGLILLGCVLTRHINAVLAGLLPVTFILLAANDWLRHRKQPREHVRAANSSFNLVANSRTIAMSIALGIVVVLAAGGCTRLLCRYAHIRFRSEVGFTVMWRLNFLEHLTPAERHRLLKLVGERVNLPESRRLLDLLEGWLNGHNRWDPEEFVRSARRTLQPPQMKFGGLRFDESLNDVGVAFLRPPVAPLVSAAWRDFKQALGITEGNVVSYLFATTAYDAAHSAAMPQLAGLTTFRGPQNIFLKFRDAPYFRCWNFLSFRAWLIIWVSTAIVASRLIRFPQSKNLSYASALVGVGLLVTMLTCFFARIHPRFALPMMELLFLSLVVLISMLLGGQIDSPSA